MSKLYRYGVEDRDYNEGTFFTENYKEAERYAAERNLRVIEHVYEWADSYVVKDFTPNDEEEE